VSSGVESVTSYSYRPDGLDQIDQMTLPDGTTRSFSYDPRGNLLSDGLATYTYDAADRLANVTGGGHTLAFAYDAAGQRFRQTADGSVTNFLWDETSELGDVLAETGGDGAQQRLFVSGEGGVLAQRDAAGLRYLLHDGHGSTNALLDETGAVVESYLYDAFGTLRGGLSAPATSYLYNGQPHDPRTGLYYLRARHYQPENGRFLSRDTFYNTPDNPTELNRYVYSANNPVTLADPTGLVAAVEYGVTLKPSEERLREHARYVNGITPSSGPDATALFSSAALMATADQLAVEMLAAILLRDIPDQGWRMPFSDRYTFGIGTVKHLRTNTHTKAIALNNFQWSKLAFNLRSPTAILTAGVLAIAGSVPGFRVELLMRRDLRGVPGFGMENHAEIIIARWALARYGSYPTPHRMLDIATSRPACTRFGDLSCARVLATLPFRRPPGSFLLFEKTIFPSIPLILGLPMLR
jgi:RHS repeat-associated protein